MNVDENVFFREATLRICSSLDIEKALMLCVQYIQTFIPVDSMFLDLYDHEVGVMRTIAAATASAGQRLDRITPLPNEARAIMEQIGHAFFEHGQPLDVSIINRPATDPVGRIMVADFGTPDTSLLAIPLVIEKQIVGNVILQVHGQDRYQPEHAHLAGLLREPLAIAMANALKYQEVLKLKNLLADDNQYLQDELQHLIGDEIVGADFGLRHVMTMVRRVAPLDSPVLLLGETGTGKEVIATAIHHASPRHDGPLIRVNCGAIPESLIDSELFGHEKGAFTGALQQKRGRFERAHTGTIFLDEIGELPLEAQVRLLRVLQEKEIERVGGTTAIALDIRIIAATHRDLRAMINTGTFREDLYFRLHVFPITLPPLRERHGDIPALAQYFLHKKAREMKLGYLPTLTPSALEWLMAYPWPGNVRELENAVERAIILNHGEPLAFEDIHPPLERQPAENSTNSAPAQILPLDAAMAAHIQRTLTQTTGKIEGADGAAALLHINPGTLRHRMRKLGIPFGRTTSR